METIVKITLFFSVADFPATYQNEVIKNILTTFSSKKPILYRKVFYFFNEGPDILGPSNGDIIFREILDFTSQKNLITNLCRKLKGQKNVRANKFFFAPLTMSLIFCVPVENIPLEDSNEYSVVSEDSYYFFDVAILPRDPLVNNSGLLMGIQILQKEIDTLISLCEEISGLEGEFIFLQFSIRPKKS
jgi:hypothetical protein